MPNSRKDGVKAIYIWLDSPTQNAVEDAVTSGLFEHRSDFVREALRQMARECGVESK